MAKNDPVKEDSLFSRHCNMVHVFFQTYICLVSCELVSRLVTNVNIAELVTSLLLIRSPQAPFHWRDNQSSRTAAAALKWCLSFCVSLWLVLHWMSSSYLTCWSLYCIMYLTSFKCKHTWTLSSSLTEFTRGFVAAFNGMQSFVGSP